MEKNAMIKKNGGEKKADAKVSAAKKANNVIAKGEANAAIAKGAKRNKLIIFDYDGVIVDSYPSVYEVYKIVGTRLNKKIPSTFEEFKKIHLESYLKAFEHIGIISPEEVRLTTEIYAREIIAKNSPIFPGIKEVIEELSKNYILAVVSGTNKGEVLDKLTRNDIFHLFDFVYAKHDFITNPMKKEGAIENLVSKLGILKEDVVLIGDMTSDYFNAKKAGVKKILLVDYGWGYDKEKTPERVKFEVKEPKDILLALKKIGF